MTAPLNMLNELDRNKISNSVQCNIQDLDKYISLKNSDLKIISQNIRSVYCNLDDLQVSLAQLSFEADIIILTECRLDSNKPIPQITNYMSFSTMHNCNQNDGVVTYIKIPLKADVEEIKLVQASCLQIKICNHVILGIYRSPAMRNASNFIDSLNNHLEVLKSHSNITITGDINIHLIPKLKEESDIRKNRLEYLNMLSIHGLLPGHTLSTRENSCIDHVILKFNNNKCSASIAVLNTTITDHRTVFICLSKHKVHNLPPRTIEYTDFDTAYNNLLQKNITTILTCQDPYVVVDFLISQVQKSLHEAKIIKCIPKKERILKSWITPGILRCIHNRNKMQLKLRSDPYNEVLKITYRRYRNHCNYIIKKLKRKHEREILANAAKNTNKMWNAVKTITNFKPPKSHCTELLKLKQSPDEAVNAVSDFFCNIGTNLANSIKTNKLPKSHKKPLNNSNTVESSSFVLFDTDACEVVNIITNLKCESAPGWDNIPTKFIKLCKFLLAPVISHLTNLCFQSGTFPSPLKKSLVTPVYKSGRRDDVNNYRPISVLTVISKIVEKIINTRLINYLNKLNILSNSQYGFRQKKSTEDAVLALTSLITEQLDQRKKCLTIFLDLKKAFDTVSIPILIQKLEHIGIRGTPLKLLSDYLQGRTQRVKIGDYCSSDSDITFGVPQGSVLGPTLFLIYINELTNLSIEDGKIFSYADDTAVVFTGQSWDSVFMKAETGLTSVSEWLMNNLLTLNVSKTNYICFSINKKTQPSSNYKLKIHHCSGNDTKHCNCDTLSRVNSTKYLGLVVDQHLSWDEQIEYVNVRVRKMMWIFKCLRNIATYNLLNQIYKALAQSVITYCITVWGGAVKSKLINIERGQRCLLKVMFRKPFRFPTTELYESCNLLTVRKLYILQAVLRVHSSLIYDVTNTAKRRKNNVAKVRCVSTEFARRQFASQSASIYNKLNNNLDIYKLKYYECKKKITEWLKTVTYDETEHILHVSQT